MRRLSLVAGLAGGLLAGAAQAQTLALSGPASLIERDSDFTATYTLTRGGAEFTERAEFDIDLETSEDTSRATASAADIATVATTVAFAPGEDSKTFRLTVRGDNLNEDGEVFRLSVDNSAGSRVTERISVLIADDDLIAAVITAPVTVAEGADAVVRVDLGAIPTTDITLNYFIAGQGFGVDAHFPYRGPGDADLTHADGGAIVASRNDFIVTAAAASAIARIVFSIVDDSTNESAETFLFSLDSGDISGSYGSAIVSRGASRIITIAASDPVAVALAADSTTVNEGQSARFTVALSGPSAAAITVPYTVAGASGFTPADSAGGSLRIAAGDTGGVIAIGIPIVAALTAASPSQTLTVTLGDSPSAATGGGSVSRTADAAGQSARVTANFLDVAHSIAFADPATRITEGAATTTYTVTRTGPALGGGATLTVTWAYAAATPAPAAADFMGGSAPAGGTLEFTASETSKTFAIATAEDTANEPDEQFTLSLSIASAHQSAADNEGGVSLPGALSVAIADDDPVTVAIARASGSGSVAEDSGALSFTATLAGGGRASGVDTIVPFTVGGLGDAEFDITAPAGIAASAAGGTLTIAHGASSGTIAVTLLDDNLNEARKTLTVTGGAPGDSGLRLSGSGAGGAEYTTGGGEVAVVVTDSDDIAISIAADSPTATEGGEAVFTITLSKASVAEVNVEYAVLSNPIGISEGRRLTFPLGEGGVTATSAQITIPILPRQDLGAGDTANLDVTISTQVGAYLGGHTAAGRIARSSVLAETFARVRVSFTDAAHAFTLTRPAAAIDESDADADATYTLARGGPTVTGAGIVVTWAVTAGSAAAADFSAGRLPGGTLTFSGDDGGQTFAIGIEGDNLNEASETFSIAFSIAAADMPAATANGGATLPAAHAVTLNDDDDIALRVTAVTAVSEGGNAVLNLNLGAIPTTDVTVAYSLGNTAADTDVDATLSGAGADLADSGGGSITFTEAGGVATGAITLALTADNLNEAAEVFTAAIAAAGIAGAHGAPTVASGGAQTFTIAASDPVTVAIAADAGSVSEGGTARFTVRLDGASNGAAADIEVAYTVSGLTAAPTDANGGSITLAAGAASGVIALGIPSSATLNDGDSETLRVALGVITPGNGAGQVTGSGSVQVTVNYRSAARTLTVTGPGTLNETDSDLESGDYTISLSGANFAAATAVTWTVANGTTADADFAAAGDRTGTVMFATGDTSQTFTLTVAGDNLNEAAETFTVQARVADAAAGGGTAYGDAASTTITDDDPVTAAIARASGSGAVAEGGGGLDFTVTLAGGTRASGVSTIVPFAVTGLDGDEFDIAAPGGVAASATGDSLTIVQADATGTITLNLQDDTLNEARETVAVTGAAAGAGGLRLTGAGAGAVEYTSGGNTASVDVSDDDPVTVSVAAVSGTATEGGTAEFAIAINVNSAAVIMVPWSVNELSDPGVIAAASGTATFAAGASAARMQTVSVPLGQSDTLGSGDPAETLTMTLGAPTGGHGALSGAGDTAQVMVSFRSVAHILAFAGPAVTDIAEGASATYTVERSGPAITGIAIVARWAVVAGTATAADFAGGRLPEGTLRFTGSETMQRFTVAPADDNLSETSETFTVALSASPEVLASNGQVALGAAAAGIITDNDEIRASLSGPETLREETTATYRVSLSAAPTGSAVTLSWTVAGMASGAAIAARAGDFAGGIFPTGSLRFAEGVTAQSLSFATSAGAAGADGGTDNTPERTFALSLSGITGGAGMTSMSPPAPLVVTIREGDTDDPAARVERMEQAAAALNRATASLTVPVIVRRFDPGRDLASPGLALNLGGQQLLAPPSGGVAASAGGATAIGLVGLPQAGDRQEAAASSTAAPSTASTPSTTSAPAPPSLPGLASLDLDALAQLTAAQLRGLDSASPAAESRALAQLLGSSGFSATGERGGGNTLSVWGRGNYASLDGEPLEGGTRYDYDGDSYGFYLGLDGRYDEYLLGLAVGYTAGEVRLRTVSDPAAARSDFESDLVAVYPYAAWQPSERLSVWLLAGYGQGELEIEERTGAATRKAGSDTDLLLGAAGLGWRRPAVSGLDVLLRLSGTALHGETDGGRFDDGTAYAKTETDAQQLRGEAELGRVLGFEDGGRLRPYLRAGVSYDFGDGARGAATGEFGAGFQLHWPQLGLETELEIEARLTSKGGRDYREYGGTGTLRYDLGGDRRGLQLSLRPSLGLARGAADMPLDGGAFAGPRAPGFGGSGSGRGAGLGLHSELSYGIGDVRLARGLPGLLTLYGTGGLASGANGTNRYGGGLRFEAARFALDAGLRHESGADTDSELLLDATLRF